MDVPATAFDTHSQTQLRAIGYYNVGALQLGFSHQENACCQLNRANIQALLFCKTEVNFSLYGNTCDGFLVIAPPCFPHILDETEELKYNQKNVILLQNHHLAKKSQQYIIPVLSPGITHQATRKGNSYIHVSLQPILPGSVIFPWQTNASLATTKCCYTLEAEEMRLHSLKKTRFWINREEKTELEITRFERHEEKNQIK